MEQPNDPSTPASDASGEGSTSPDGAKHSPDAGEHMPPNANGRDGSTAQSIIVRQHSAILYWWPVWAVGFLFAVLSFAFGERVEIGGQQMLFHPSRNLGVIYLAVFAVVFLRTNVVLRGIVSLLVILGMIIGVLLFSLLGWWQSLFQLEQYLSVHMDAGFYLAISSVVFVAWALTILLFDRFAYCEFRPGQVVLHKTIGGGIRTCDTRGISVYKLQDDLFRNWGLGLGTGDLHIATTGAEGITLDLRNVTFIDRKLREIKRLVAMSPDGLPDVQRSAS
jgi:hypothetical protein